VYYNLRHVKANISFIFFIGFAFLLFHCVFSLSSPFRAAITEKNFTFLGLLHSKSNSWSKQQCVSPKVATTTTTKAVNLTKDASSFFYLSQSPNFCSFVAAYLLCICVCVNAYASVFVCIFIGSPLQNAEFRNNKRSHFWFSNPREIFNIYTHICAYV